ncbi:hypothetical protein PROFUN_00298 [Planoprotostelium fungivorum]|uniref:Nudix hydrolase domain-containing protein n=1 Tax=Planoprotostelium fungivorum TaxID=1890364 RepID=A0A2P6NY07_9EUKA|nr:hypothetical protein PROFUN_00298 [Planoprotostelium fungivorum]
MSTRDLSLSSEGKFKILEDTVSYKRYLTVRKRETLFDDGRQISWDVVGNTTIFVTVFTFDTKKKTTTILAEYAQGTNDLRYTLAAGAYESKKHDSVIAAARAELSEEAFLKDGEWISLLPEGIGELKWSTNVFYPFLVLDPVDDPSPPPRDLEETIQIYKDVTMDELHRIILSGDMMLPSVQTCYMAIEHLKQKQLI